MATMRSSASSNRPGMGAKPSAASPRSGRGMRLSLAAIFTARRVLLRLLMVNRGICSWGDFYRTVLAFPPEQPSDDGAHPDQTCSSSYLTTVPARKSGSPRRRSSKRTGTNPTKNSAIETTSPTMRTIERPTDGTAPSAL
jgi:hypothetical protein